MNNSNNGQDNSSKDDKHDTDNDANNSNSKEPGPDESIAVINNPHDKFFKETLSDPETVRDFLKNYLTEQVLDMIDLDSIYHEKDSFIEKDMKEFFSDILFSVRINNRDGYLYFLFEHKSYREVKIALQLLNYMLKIWKQKKFKGKKTLLPPIIPLVVYHGEEEWDIGPTLGHLIAGMETMSEQEKEFIPDYKYLIYDLSPYGSEEIRGGAKLRIFLDLLKNIFVQDDETFLRTLKKAIIALEELSEKKKGSEYFETIVRYVLNARKNTTYTDISNVTKEVSMERSAEFMTIAEQLINEGIEKGMEITLIAMDAFREGKNIDDVVEITGLEKEKLIRIKDIVT